MFPETLQYLNKQLEFIQKTILSNVRKKFILTEGCVIDERRFGTVRLIGSELG